MNREEMIRKLKRSVRQVDPMDLYAEAHFNKGLKIIDCRETQEYENGSIANAIHISRGFLEMKVSTFCPNRDASIVIYCQTGIRSLFACKTLMDLGYTQVASLAGGLDRWKKETYKVEPPPGLSARQRKRYEKHIALPEVGSIGQEKLSKARVLLVGLGGLGSAAAFYLSAAGVGTLGLVDHDVVDESNLQRQILHTERGIGTKKVDSAFGALKNLNSALNVICYPNKLLSFNVEALVSEYDVIIDGTDNFATRYLLNDACCKFKKPLVHGSIFRFEGQISLFTPGWSDSPCYRCLYPAAPEKESLPTCGTLGVLGVLPGVIGVLMATETIKAILELGNSLVGRLVIYDALAAVTREIKIKRRKSCLLH